MLLRKAAKRPMHAVIRGIGMGKAMHRVLAMAEGHDRRRRHEAKRGEGGNRHRHAEAKPGAECPQHGSSLVGRGAPCNPRYRSQIALPTADYGKTRKPGRPRPRCRYWRHQCPLRSRRSRNPRAVGDQAISLRRACKHRSCRRDLSCRAERASMPRRRRRGGAARWRQDQAHQFRLVLHRRKPGERRAPRRHSSPQRL